MLDSSHIRHVLKHTIQIRAHLCTRTVLVLYTAHHTGYESSTTGGKLGSELLPGVTRNKSEIGANCRTP
eukprot:scaffold426435_cov38-Prasinocladus_malaysianus.AAC.1